MSDFRTILSPQKASISIGYQTPTICIGSCFAENIGRLLIESKVPTSLNPFGILYNPISIKQSLDRIISGAQYTATDLFFHQDLWHSFDHHGVFSHPSQQAKLELINNKLEAVAKFLKKTNRLILTLGTANVFVNKATGKIVANCHKLPNTEFEKKRLSVSEIVFSLQPTLKKLKTINPDCEVIFTVSPVRHLKDGIIENQLSKAILLLAIEEMMNQLDYLHYFPAYELVLDDLRDYRFFEKDMMHPNESAIQYIWDFFQQTYFSKETYPIFNKVKKIVQASKHRPFHKNIYAHQQFVKKQLGNITELEEQYPFLLLTNEREIFQAQISEVPRVD